MSKLRLRLDPEGPVAQGMPGLQEPPVGHGSRRRRAGTSPADSRNCCPPLSTRKPIYVIGLTGPAGCGKDAVADILVRRHGYRRAAFADKLKLTCTSLGWDGVKDARGRRFLQALGTVVREYNDDAWIDLLFGTQPPWFWAAGPAVISDVRFVNEATRIKDLGGRIVRVTGRSLYEDCCWLWRFLPGWSWVPAAWRTRRDSARAAAHVSERAMHRYRADHTINNSGTLEDLALAVDRLRSATCADD